MRTFFATTTFSRRYVWHYPEPADWSSGGHELLAHVAREEGGPPNGWQEMFYIPHSLLAPLRHNNVTKVCSKGGLGGGRCFWTCKLLGYKISAYVREFTDRSSARHCQWLERCPASQPALGSRQKLDRR